MRPEPLVMTTKFTITRIEKTITPMTKLPLISNLPNASMTAPAACEPSWPSVRMVRVVARLSASRIIVEISRTVGKELKSRGRWMNSDTIRIRTEKVIEIASEKSSSQRGIGSSSTSRIVTMPSARPISVWRIAALSRPSRSLDPDPALAAAVSLMVD